MMTVEFNLPVLSCIVNSIRLIFARQTRVTSKSRFWKGSPKGESIIRFLFRHFKFSAATAEHHVMGYPQFFQCIFHRCCKHPETVFYTPSKIY